jgi:predicted amidophosphoribosyltransferase
MGYGDEVHDLVWGSRCAGCDNPGRELCRGCRARLSRSPAVERSVTGSAGELTCLAGASYDDLVQRLVPAWKNGGRTGLLGPLAGRLEAALGVLTTASDEVWLVPVPSRPSALMVRGFSPPLLLARRAAWPRPGAGRRPPRLAVGALLAPDVTRDQVGLGRRGRQENVGHSFRPGDPMLLALLQAAGDRGAAVLLVDDVVTTGSTLAETARVLAAEGVRVSGAVAVADTPPGRHAARAL